MCKALNRLVAARTLEWVVVTLLVRGDTHAQACNQGLGPGGHPGNRIPGLRRRSRGYGAGPGHGRRYGGGPGHRTAG